jgi:hypothetical protein
MNRFGLRVQQWILAAAAIFIGRAALYANFNVPMREEGYLRAVLFIAALVCGYFVRRIGLRRTRREAAVQDNNG